MKPVSKGLYLGSVVAGYTLFALLMVSAVVTFIMTLPDSRAPGPNGRPPAPQPEDFILPGGLFCASFLPMLGAAVMLFILVYKMWAAIQDGRARATPGQAVGYLFIPIFNLYWMFMAYWGWAVDYNKFIDRHRLRAPRVSENLALATCVLPLMGGIPYIGVLFSLAGLVVQLVYFWAVIDGINAIAADPPDLSRVSDYEDDEDDDYRPARRRSGGSRGRDDDRGYDGDEDDRDDGRRDDRFSDRR